MSMSKKDYIAIASAIRSERSCWPKDESLGDEFAYAALRSVTSRLAEVFAADNPRFDRNRFLEACDL